MLQIFQVVHNTLVTALQGLESRQPSAQTVLFLIEGHLMAALGGDSCRLHTGRATADDHDVPGRFCGQGIVTFGHILGKSPGQSRVDPAVHGGAHVNGGHKTGHAVGAGGHILPAALL